MQAEKVVVECNLWRKCPCLSTLQFQAAPRKTMVPQLCWAWLLVAHSPRVINPVGWSWENQQSQRLLLLFSKGMFPLCLLSCSSPITFLQTPHLITPWCSHSWGVSPCDIHMCATTRERHQAPGHGTDTNSSRLWRLLVVAFTSLFSGENTVECWREQLQCIISSWCVVIEQFGGVFDGWDEPVQTLLLICSGMGPPSKSTDLLSPNIIVSGGHRETPLDFVFLHLGGLNPYSPVLASSSCFVFILWFQVIHGTCQLGSMSGASQGCFPQTNVGSKAFTSSGHPIIPELVTATALHSLMCPSCPHCWDTCAASAGRCGGVSCIQGSEKDLPGPATSPELSFSSKL